MITLIVGICAFALGCVLARLITGNNKAKSSNNVAESVVATSGDAHPVKCQTSPVTPHEALTLESTDVTRLDFLIGWVNGQLCKLNNKDLSTVLNFPTDKQNRKTVDAIKDIFSAHGWDVKEVPAIGAYGDRITSRIDLKFSTTEQVRVTLDDVKENGVRVDVAEVDELEQKFVDLAKKMEATSVKQASKKKTEFVD